MFYTTIPLHKLKVVYDVIIEGQPLSSILYNLKRVLRQRPFAFTVVVYLCPILRLSLECTVEPADTI